MPQRDQLSCRGILLHRHVKGKVSETKGRCYFRGSLTLECEDQIFKNRGVVFVKFTDMQRCEGQGFNGRGIISCAGAHYRKVLSWLKTFHYLSHCFNCENRFTSYVVFLLVLLVFQRLRMLASGAQKCGNPL